MLVVCIFYFWWFQQSITRKRWAQKIIGKFNIELKGNRKFRKIRDGIWKTLKNQDTVSFLSCREWLRFSSEIKWRTCSANSSLTGSRLSDSKLRQREEWQQNSKEMKRIWEQSLVVLVSFTWNWLEANSFPSF